MLMCRSAGVLGLAAVLGALAGCGNSARVSQEDLDPAAVIRQAAERSGAASFGFTIDQTMSGERSVADGEYEGGPVPAMQFRSSDGKFAMISIGADSYVHVTDGGGLFPAGRWSKSSEDDPGETDLRKFFTALLAAGSVDDLGPEHVEGVPTRHYAGTITVADLQAASMDDELRQSLLEDVQLEKDGATDIQAWIDQDFQIRRFSLAGEYKGGDWNPVGAHSFTVTLRDFGKDFDITAPPTAEVVDSADVPLELPDEFGPKGNLDDPKCQKAVRKQWTRYAEHPTASPDGPAVLPKACR